ncbi:DEAD/DEAH box helicase [Sandaracinobacter neustonicus]|uniref:DEAD/DEAH box helicase n=1 Tax=Sandaracinobacter neustonicus TaxID=1715348 RepID=UPI001F3AB479|nr:DEAD/DEAH box helicase [Sandaracinobacter neustonicus]
MDTQLSFPTLPLLAEALAARGYTEPTAVQAAVLQPETAGRDLIVSAQTGSGKTVAFGLAIAPQLLDEEGKARHAFAPLALAIAPTRELALQVSRELEWLYAGAQLRVVTCVGGMDAARERRALAGGAHVVVGTPGRLRDHLERGALDLGSLSVAILDEADEMLDMGFREDLEEILDATPEGRRTLLFSATMPRPIVALAKRYQRDAFTISTVGEDRGHGDISYQAVTVAPSDIENAVVNLLRFHEADTAILFAATRENVRRLHASLSERGFDAVMLSGESSQSERNQALQALRDRRARVCVATDVAARGIDLPGLSLVIHVEIPRDAETLQHRSGRTGRAGAKGTAILLVPYPRRRRVEGLLRDARITAEWRRPPTAEEIREKDRARLLHDLLQPVEIEEGDADLIAQLLADRTPEQLAAQLLKASRAKLPAPEDMLDGGKPETATAKEHRPGFDDVVWFRMSIGRRQNADPRWILPLICRRGHLTRSEVGAIRIQAAETHFAIPRASAARFAAAVRRTAQDGGDDESGVQFEQLDGGRPGPQAAAAPRPHTGPARPHGGPAKPHAAKPWKDKAGKPGGGKPNAMKRKG